MENEFVDFVFPNVGKIFIFEKDDEIFRIFTDEYL